MRRHLPYVLDRLERYGYEASAHATSGYRDATKAARVAVERKFDLVVAAGGDGTLFEVINGLAEQPERPRLALLPMGTTNDFARAVGIPRAVEKACNIIGEGVEIPVDVGKVNGQYFMNIAGGGKLTELTYDVPSKMKTMLGQLAYYLKGIELLPSIRPTEVEIAYDGKFFTGKIMLFLVANTNSVGGFEKLAPNSLLNDGRFDLIIIQKAGLAELINLAFKALRGEHIHDPHVLYAKASTIEVRTKEKMQLNLDGEFGGFLPGRFTNLRGHLRMLVPRETAARFSINK